MKLSVLRFKVGAADCTCAGPLHLWSAAA